MEATYAQIDTPARRTFVSDERHVKVTAELIAERFGIGPTRAQRTLSVTTQRGVRSAILPIKKTGPQIYRTAAMSVSGTLDLYA